ncbi:ABC transporter substrate-binding protein [Acidovorax sp. BL-A-41-H1]|uniref:ABC transporter substrate-binding protein n=1 Tax=Acidovorax sp. BL-A-41-H1 TaxID=3421102 RepID=UPI003F791550
MKPFSPSRRAFGAASALSAVATAAVFAPGLRAQGSGASPSRVTVAVGGQGVLYHLPLVLADLLGYFKAEGVEVSIRDFAAGALALEAVDRGQADVCAGAFEHTLRRLALGQNYQAVVTMGRAPQLALGVSLRSMPGYREPGQLAGKRIGVSSVGSSTHLAATLLLAREGVDMRRVSFVNVGTGMAAFSALRSGQIHALCHADPIMTVLEQKEGLRIIGDVRSLKSGQDLFGGTMPAGCLYAKQGYIQKNAAQAQALVSAIVHALKWLQTAGPADLVKVVPEGYLLGDRSAYLAAFGRVRETYSTHGAMPDDGVATALRVLIRAQPEIAGMKLDPARTFNPEFVRKARAKYGV